MGEIADAIINGEFDMYTGEYLGEPCGYPRTIYYDNHFANDRSYRKVQHYMSQRGVKEHRHPEVLKAYGMPWPRKSPLKKACMKVLQDYEAFKKWFDKNYAQK
jgi:hypothetical protein